jgi:hypothetical protein
VQAGQEGPRTKLGSHSGAGAGGEGAKKISVSTSYRVGIGPLSVSRSSRRADVERGGMVISLYDKRLPDYSPKGKNTVNLTPPPDGCESGRTGPDHRRRHAGAAE